MLKIKENFSYTSPLLRVFGLELYRINGYIERTLFVFSVGHFAENYSMV